MSLLPFFERGLERGSCIAVYRFHRKNITIFVLKMNPLKVAKARPSEGSFCEKHIFTFYFNEIRELSGRIINDRIFE